MWGGGEAGAGMYTWVHIEVPAKARKNTLDPLYLQMQVVVGNSLWMLGACHVLHKGSTCS